MADAASDPGQLPADNRRALRQVARSCRKAMLATVMADGSGAPYASLVTVALDHDLAPILLLSGLADHTRNLAADSRVSLLLDGTDGHPNPQTGPRVTLMGRAAPTTDERLKRRFLARHPAAALYAGFADFSLWRVAPARAHFVGGFGRAVWFEAPFGLSPAVTAAFAAAETAGALPSRPAVAEAEEWRPGAADPDGIDLIRGDRAAWHPFPTPLDSPDALEAAVSALLARVNT